MVKSGSYLEIPNDKEMSDCITNIIENQSDRQYSNDSFEPVSMNYSGSHSIIITSAHRNLMHTSINPENEK
jgi:Txe/YoeB family toxin of Txe-Axe toxin-antitoxin module